MSELDEDLPHGSNIEPKEGERRPLSSNEASGRSPSLEYIYLPDQEKVNRAFDILFREVLKDSPWNQKSR